VEEASLGLLIEVGQRLGLRVTRDDTQRKLYLGLPRAAVTPEYVPDGIRYPSGKSIPKARPSEAEAARYGTTGVYAAAPLLAARSEDPLSEHFKAFEFMCHDASYRYVRVAVDLVEALEKIRAELGGRPIHVNSGYRPAAYNRLVGGEVNSSHIDGLAADIEVVGVQTARLYEVCDHIIGDHGGVGFYPDSGFVHVDVRGHRARWVG
jgi:hypothetical protein